MQFLHAASTPPSPIKFTTHGRVNPRRTTNETQVTGQNGRSLLFGYCGGGAAIAALVTYDANQAFVAMETGSVTGVNPFNQFSVGYGTGSGSFTAFASGNHTNSFSGNADIQGYFVNNPQIVPAVTVNVSGASTPMVNIGASLDAGQIYLHPGSLNLGAAHIGTINDAIVRFTAPTAGSYSITGDWEKLHFGTTSKQVLVNGVSIFSQTAANPSFSLTANLNVNDRVDFLVNAAGAISGDSVGLRARLTTDVVVAPPTCTPPQVPFGSICKSPPSSNDLPAKDALNNR